MSLRDHSFKKSNGKKYYFWLIKNRIHKWSWWWFIEKFRHFCKINSPIVKCEEEAPWCLLQNENSSHKKSPGAKLFLPTCSASLPTLLHFLHLHSLLKAKLLKLIEFYPTIQAGFCNERKILFVEPCLVIFFHQIHISMWFKIV